MKRFFFILVFTIFLLSFQKDIGAWKRLFTVKYSADFFTTDNIGNIYLVKNDEIVKYNASGELLKKYSNKKIGKIFSIDASNALRVLVYYKDFSVIVLLDSQLSQNGENISLEDMQLEQSDLACTSFQNGIWLYNRQNAELVRLDESLNKVVNTGNLNRILSTELHPNFLLEYNGYIYLNNPSTGILVFDIYGTYSKTISIAALTSLQMREFEMYYFQNKKMEDYHTKELWTIDVALPDTNVVSARVEKGKYYLQFKDSVSLYSFAH